MIIKNKNFIIMNKPIKIILTILTVGMLFSFIGCRTFKYLSFGKLLFKNEMNQFVGVGGEVILNITLSPDDPKTKGLDPDGKIADPDDDGPIKSHKIVRLDVGDRLAGIGWTTKINCVSCRSSGKNVHQIDFSTDHGKAALRAFQVIDKKLNEDGTYSFKFGPLTPEQYSETIKEASNGAINIPPESIPPGTVILSYIDKTPKFTLKKINGSPKINWIEATNGVRHWNVGIKTDIDFWESRFKTDNVGILEVMPKEYELGQINFGLSVLDGSRGKVKLNKVKSIHNTEHDFVLEGKAIGTYNSDEAFPIGLQTTITFSYGKVK